MTELENPQLVDQRLSAIDAFFESYGPVLAKSGSIVGSYRQHGNRRSGPYYRLTCRDAGRQRSVYLGVEASLVELVGERLAMLQRVIRHDRQIRAARKAVRRQSAAAKLLLDHELAIQGLVRKGSELRGWRTAIGGKTKS